MKRAPKVHSHQVIEVIVAIMMLAPLAAFPQDDASFSIESNPMDVPEDSDIKTAQETISAGYRAMASTRDTSDEEMDEIVAAEMLDFPALRDNVSLSMLSPVSGSGMASVSSVLTDYTDECVDIPMEAEVVSAEAIGGRVNVIDNGDAESDADVFELDVGEFDINVVNETGTNVWQFETDGWPGAYIGTRSLSYPITQDSCLSLQTMLRVRYPENPTYYVMFHVVFDTANVLLVIQRTPDASFPFSNSTHGSLAVFERFQEFDEWQTFELSIADLYDALTVQPTYIVALSVQIYHDAGFSPIQVSLDNISLTQPVLPEEIFLNGNATTTTLAFGNGSWPLVACDVSNKTVASEIRINYTVIKQLECFGTCWIDDAPNGTTTLRLLCNSSATESITFFIHEPWALLNSSAPYVCGGSDAEFVTNSSSFWLDLVSPNPFSNSVISSPQPRNLTFQTYVDGCDGELHMVIFNSTNHVHLKTWFQVTTESVTLHGQLAGDLAGGSYFVLLLYAGSRSVGSALHAFELELPELLVEVQTPSEILESESFEIELQISSSVLIRNVSFVVQCLNITTEEISGFCDAGQTTIGLVSPPFPGRVSWGVTCFSDDHNISENLFTIEILPFTPDIVFDAIPVYGGITLRLIACVHEHPISASYELDVNGTSYSGALDANGKADHFYTVTSPKMIDAHLHLDYGATIFCYSFFVAVTPLFEGHEAMQVCSNASAAELNVNQTILVELTYPHFGDEWALPIELDFKPIYEIKLIRGSRTYSVQFNNSHFIWELESSHANVDTLEILTAAALGTVSVDETEENTNVFVEIEHADRAFERIFARIELDDPMSFDWIVEEPIDLGIQLTVAYSSLKIWNIEIAKGEFMIIKLVGSLIQEEGTNSSDLLSPMAYIVLLTSIAAIGAGAVWKYRGNKVNTELTL